MGKVNSRVMRIEKYRQERESQVGSKVSTKRAESWYDNSRYMIYYTRIARSKINVAELKWLG